jgi:hypothetical protein
MGARRPLKGVREGEKGAASYRIAHNACMMAREPRLEAPVLRVTPGTVQREQRESGVAQQQPS